MPAEHNFNAHFRFRCNACGIVYFYNPPHGTSTTAASFCGA